MAHPFRPRPVDLWMSGEMAGPGLVAGAGFDRSDVVLQLEVEFVDEGVGGVPALVAADFVDHQIDGHTGMRAELCDGRFNSLSGFFDRHDPPGDSNGYRLCSS